MLVPRNLVALLAPDVVASGLEVQREQVLLAGSQLRAAKRQVYALGSPGRCAQDRQPAPLYAAAARQHFEASAKPRQIAEVLQVRDPNTSPREVARLDPHRLSQLLDLPQRRMRSAVGEGHAVDAEVTFVGLVYEIAAVGP